MRSYCSTAYNADHKHVYTEFGVILARRPHVDRAYLLCCLFLNFISPQSIIIVKYALVPSLCGDHFFYVLSCYGQSSGSSGLAFNRLSGKNSGFLKSTDSKTVSTAECLYLLYHCHVIIRDKE